jgi:hypothetical protein
MHGGSLGRFLMVFTGRRMSMPVQMKRAHLLIRTMDEDQELTSRIL